MTKEELLNHTLEDLGRVYPNGLYEYLFKYQKNLFTQLMTIEKRIDQIYLNPDTTTNELKLVLREYWNLHVKAIKEFKQVKNISLMNLAKIREELIQERIRA